MTVWSVRLGVFLLALVVRLTTIELTGAHRTTFGDAADYAATARSICTQQVYPERGNLPFFRAPGLPFFIAGVTACEPSRTRAIKYGLAGCDALAALFIAMMAMRLHSQRAGIIAGAVASLNPFFVGAVTDIRSEPLFMMLLTGAILALLQARPALSGLAVGLASLVRPTALLCIPLFAVYAALRLPDRWRAGALLLLCCGLTLAPWTVRNIIRFGEPIVVNDAAGFNLWRGSHPVMIATMSMRERDELRRVSLTFESSTIPAAAQVVDSRATTPGERDREWRKLAMGNVRADPGSAFRNTIRKALYYWRPWLHPAEYGRGAMALSVLVNGGLYLVGGIGLLRYRDRALVVSVIVFVVVLWLAHLPYVPTIRLRSPLTDPLLIAFGSAFLAGRRSLW